MKKLNVRLGWAKIIIKLSLSPAFVAIFAFSFAVAMGDLI